MNISNCGRLLRRNHIQMLPAETLSLTTKKNWVYIPLWESRIIYKYNVTEAL